MFILIKYMFKYKHKVMSRFSKIRNSVASVRTMSSASNNITMYTRVIILSIVLTVPVSHVTGSTKKGVAGTSSSLLCDDFKALNNMSWWYTWGKDLNTFNTYVANSCSGTTNNHPEFVPMVWSYHRHGRILNITKDAHFILGFNEPDGAKQAHMTPKEAADAWPEVESQSHGIPLVSPATASHSLNWYDEFFRHCNSCRIDYVAAHSYICNAAKTMEYLHTLYTRYGRQVWLTEFACPHTTDVHKQLHFMQAILPRLEAAYFVFRYSWYSARIKHANFVTSSASLLHANTSTLTLIGRYYNRFQGNHKNSPDLIG